MVSANALNSGHDLLVLYKNCSFYRLPCFNKTSLKVHSFAFFSSEALSEFEHSSGNSSRALFFGKIAEVARARYLFMSYAKG